MIIDKGYELLLGDIIAENYIVSSSTMFVTTSYSSGNTVFGDTLNDVPLLELFVDKSSGDENDAIEGITNLMSLNRYSNNKMRWRGVLRKTWIRSDFQKTLTQNKQI